MEASVNEVTLNGIEYIRKDLASLEPIKGNIKIVVLQRGWNLVGRFESISDGESILHKASVIRTWGTTKGLGQLSLKGPTSDTVLDPCHGVVRFHPLTVVLTIDCEESKWVQYLK